jgi:UDP-glucose 4-epimerase
MLDRSTVLVTGGLGAIGSALCRAMLQRGVRKMAILDDCSSSVEAVSADVIGDTRVTFVRGSITDDARLDEAFGVRPGIVFHLAANFANQNSIDHPVRDCEVNGLGTAKVLELSRIAGVDRFVFASSSCVYGHTDTFDVTTTKFLPETPYAVNKLHGEFQVGFYHQFHKMHTVVLRYFNSFGPGELPGRYRNVIPNFFLMAMRGEALPITGDETTSRDFNYVDNTVEATLLSALSDKSGGRTYNVGSGRETPIHVLATKINALTGNKAGIIFKPARSWDTINRRVADISRTVEDLGYEPDTDLDAQLEATYKWLKDNEKHFPPF